MINISSNTACFLSYAQTKNAAEFNCNIPIVGSSQTVQWGAPTPMPEDVGTGEPPKMYSWDEDTTSWVVVETEGV